MNTKREIFISVDIETSGPIPGEYSLLTIGACNVDDDNQTFTCQIKPISHKADPKALEVTGLSLDKLEREGIQPFEAMQKFNNWIEAVAEKADLVVFVGFNAAFDWSFINYYFHRYLGKNPFGFTALDIKSFYMGKMGCSWYQTRSSHIANIMKPQLRGDHDALHDAQYQAEIFRLICNSIK
jgi:ribonuclease T